MNDETIALVRLAVGARPQFFQFPLLSTSRLDEDAIIERRRLRTHLLK